MINAIHEWLTRPTNEWMPDNIVIKAIVSFRFGVFGSIFAVFFFIGLSGIYTLDSWNTVIQSTSQKLTNVFITAITNVFIAGDQVGQSFGILRPLGLYGISVLPYMIYLFVLLWMYIPLRLLLQWVYKKWNNRYHKRIVHHEVKK